MHTVLPTGSYSSEAILVKSSTVGKEDNMPLILQCTGTETRSRGMIASHATRESGTGTGDAPRRTRDRRHSAGHLLHAQTLQGLAY